MLLRLLAPALLLAGRALARSPFYMQLNIDGRAEPIDFDLDPEEPWDIKAAVQQFGDRHGLAAAARDDLIEVVRKKAIDLGIEPVLKIALTLPNGTIPHTMRYHIGEDLEEVARKAGRVMDLPFWTVNELITRAESDLEKLGYGESARPFPTGTLNMPDRQIDLYRMLRRVRVHFPANYKIWDKNLEAITHALSEYGRRTGLAIPFEAVSEVHSPDYDSLYILYSMGEPIRLPRYYIAMQMEQLPYTPMGDRYLRKLRAALEVWDYSLLNLKYLADRGIEARHVPLAYGPSMELPHPLVRRTNHVIFFGGFANRRFTVVPAVQQDVEAAGLRMRICTNDCWGDERFDALVNVNIHSWDESIIEAHRIIHLVANRVWVVSEPSNDTWYDERIGRVADIVPTEQLASRIIEICSMPGDVVMAELERRHDLLVKEWHVYDVYTQAGALEFLAERLELKPVEGHGQLGAGAAGTASGDHDKGGGGQGPGSGGAAAAVGRDEL